MSSAPTATKPARQPSVHLRGAQYSLTRAEVGALVTLSHEDLVAGGTLADFRESWGLCDRHSWGQVVLEIEQANRDSVEQFEPIQLATQYEDLLTFMSYRLGVGRIRLRNDALQGSGECWTCEQLANHEDTPEAVDPSLLQRCTTMEQFESRLRQTRTAWTNKVCPDCAAEAFMKRTGAIRCRMHLVAAGRAHAETLADVVDELTNVRFRIRQLLAPGTHGTAAPTIQNSSAWVEALGWFHGWTPVLDLGKPRNGR